MRTTLTTGLLAGLFSLTVSTQSAHAEEWWPEDIQPYIGIEYDYMTTDNIAALGNDLFAEDYQGIAPYAGLRFGNGFALEVGYLQTSEEDQTTTGTGALAGDTLTTSSELSGWYGDFIGFLPLGESQRFMLVGSLGLALYEAESDALLTGPNTAAAFGSSPVSAKLSEDSLGGRIGLGAQYDVTDHLSLRTMVRYTAIDFESSLAGVQYGVEDIFSVGIGASWRF